MKGTQVQSQLGKILRAMGQLSPCTATTEARAPQEKPPNEKPYKEQFPLTATRESPSAAK